ncbi:chaperonin 10-like protein [Pisolithus croceorrhizus]|nr:chaperonin 10-like protein [Pisolithus croceorrhizus]KAI6133775.1 chaperonin 10-like protein [Pisolithus croceorrhizus]KAI6164052.1 chaperonin 10-like protein [Pisolithus thermaeus]
MTSVPQTQTAWVATTRGPPSRVLQVNHDYPVPIPTKSGDVLVKIQAAALNPAGWKIMTMAPNFVWERPYIPEVDISGVVVDANESQFSNGDQVIGFISTAVQRSTRQGALSQYVSLPASQLVLKPSNRSFSSAAGIPLVGQTALQALRLAGFDVLHHRRERNEGTTPKTIFVNGGSTSVGIYTIQIAKSMGLRVVASASGRNEAFVRGLGADEFIDYTVEPLHAYLTRKPPTPLFSLVLDAAALIDPSLYTHSEAYLDKSGMFISVGPWPFGRGWMACLLGTMKYLWAILQPGWAGGVKRSWKIISVTHRQADLQKLCEMVEAGTVCPVTDSAYDLNNVLDAYEQLMGGHAVGKVVVNVIPERGSQEGEWG